MKILTSIVAAFGLLAATATSASAAFIQGQIDFVGAVTRADDGMGNVTSLSFAGVTVLGLTTTGDLTAIDNGTAVTFNPATIATVAPFTPTPLVGFWTADDGVDIASFDMNSYTVQQGNGLAVDLVGKGILNLTGFDPTVGVFSLSVQETGGATLSFSATTTSVSEPGMIGILGLGLIGLGVAVRRRK